MKPFSLFEVICVSIMCILLGINIGIAIAQTCNYSFCPECGRRYVEAQYCKYDGTKLEEPIR